MQRKALLATNFYNLETLLGVIHAAREVNVPLILQLTKSSIDYIGLQMAVAMARSVSRQHEVQTWLHLDHGDSLELAVKCMDAGFDSVMIDASEKPFKENILLTRQVVRKAEEYGICVEGELGYVAKIGQCREKLGFTEPDEAKTFVEDTGVDSLAVAIGTAHGFYAEEPKLDLERLNRIDKLVGSPLVLHGCTGISNDSLREAIFRGICKINFATEIKHTFMTKVRNDIATTQDIDLRKVFLPAICSVKDLVKDKLQALDYSNINA